MKLKELFKLDVSRNIETVIKADDQENIFQEVDEYVITNEIARKIKDFFSNYINYAGINGVWISGFFGSGKSHLLKILSYILENKEYNGWLLGELFASKIEEDAILKADVLKAAKIPSESILFNIDQQAQITSKNDEDAILKVFYKVFYDHMGFYGGLKHVAEFELWLTQEGKYDEFIHEFEAIAEKHWFQGRRQTAVPKIKSAVATTLSKIYGEPEENYATIIDDFRNDHSAIWIEDYCEKVNTYIQSKEPGFRLNFFVDEVGQYISENTKLMLNLQTIAETLATKSRGKAWLLVTSQEDLESLIGDDSTVQSDDFSKIQGRFRVRIPLTSANVDEVIEKRLLAKNDPGKAELSIVWNKEQSNLETLLSFSETGVQFRGFKGEADFINKYPFIPYQFDLFQQSVKSLSKHNAFQGKHASTGERSMLGVFQEVLKQLAEQSNNSITSFDMLFEGLRSAIRGEIQNTIILAERQLTSDFAKKVLKVLFMVKYYDQFKTTARNISVLMIDSLHVDLKAHEKEVQLALNLLENQNYIQRNAETYEFLTDDEQDVEREIKNTEIDGQAITSMLSKLLFDDVIRDTRFRFLDNKQEYEFTRKLDGAILSKERELTIEIITPNNDRYGDAEFYKGETVWDNTLIRFVIPDEGRILEETRLYLKTEKYIKQNHNSSTKDTISKILRDKGFQNAQKYNAYLRPMLNRAMGKSMVFLNGKQHEIMESTDGRIKVVNAFQDLIKLAYPSLKMLGAVEYREETIKTILQSKQDDLFGQDDTCISEAENEILNFVIRRKKQSDRTSLTDLKDHFTKKPYGWYQTAIWCVCARVFKRGKLEFRQDSNLLTDADVLAAFNNNRTYSNTLLEPQMEFDQRLIKKLKEVYQDAFDKSCGANEPKEVVAQFRQKVTEEYDLVLQYIVARNQYAFMKILEPLKELLHKLVRMEYGVLINTVNEWEDKLLDAKEDILDPIKRFWNGEQKKIYDQIRIYLDGDQSNFEFIDGEEVALLSGHFNHPKPYEGNVMREAKSVMDGLMNKVRGKITQEKYAAISKVEAVKEALASHADFAKLTPEEQNRITAPLDELKAKADSQRYIANLQQYQQQASNLKIELLNKIQALVVKPIEDGKTDYHLIKYIRSTNVKVKFPKSELTSREDVEEYTEALKKALLHHIEENRRITL
ncbi:MAG TPA: BREX system P-loop protein BrxC [Bacteroidales bacterium]|nr:BREX system P-loop protein BrxC [Bacteroidales bacterium]